MDATEEHVSRYLEHAGHTNVVYEPDGSIPPDFSIQGRIAVEVRRLNQNAVTDSGHEGLEEAAFPLHALVRRALDSAGPPLDGETWFVMFTYRRPLSPWKTLRQELDGALRRFRVATPRAPGRVRVSGGLTLHFIKASKTHKTFFVLGGSVDRDSGGFVLSELRRNIVICASEKARKVQAVRGKYPEWWLVLVDHIDYSSDAVEREQLRQLVQIEHPWDRIILVHPADVTRAYAL